jgi:hypothetical protein
MIRSRRFFKRLNMFAKAFHSTINSPHPRGEDLLRQLYAYDGLQYRIQHLEAWTSTNNRHWHSWKEEKRRNLHTKVTNQSLSDYAQQD